MVQIKRCKIKLSAKTTSCRVDRNTLAEVPINRQGKPSKRVTDIIAREIPSAVDTKPICHPIQRQGKKSSNCLGHFACSTLMHQLNCPPNVLKKDAECKHLTGREETRPLSNAILVKRERAGRATPPTCWRRFIGHSKRNIRKDIS